MKPSVIAAVDLDRKAEGIIRRAANLARLCRADLVVVHVVEGGGTEAGYLPFIGPTDVRQDTVRSARGWLHGLLHHLVIPEAEAAVVEGLFQTEISDLARQRNACYVLTGQSRWGVLSRLGGLESALQTANPHCHLLGVGGSRAGKENFLHESPPAGINRAARA